MSRIGTTPIEVPANVKVNLDPAKNLIEVEGPKGKLSFSYRSEVNVAWEESEKRIVCTVDEANVRDRQHRAYWGTTRARIQNMIIGVTEGYSKVLEIIGVGWNAQAQGKTLRLNVGYCHPVDMAPPEGVEFAIEANRVTVSGPDKQAVGQFAANIRSKREPEPYNGKGIKYRDEVIMRKAGKAFGS